MRFLIAALAVLTLAGCYSITRLGPDSFEASHVSPQTYENDTAACRHKADDAITYDVRLAGVTGYARNRSFNRVFAACMTERGYKPRSYIENILPTD